MSDLNALRARLESRISGAAARAEFLARYDRLAPDIDRLLSSLYGHRPDYDERFEAILETALQGYLDRPDSLRELDRERESAPPWYQTAEMVGAVCYVDRFAGTLAGLRERLPYLQELGVRYLHLMPLFRTPPGPSDGGYAVSSYREVNPALGSIDELRALARELRAVGISLVLDFVFNHTASDHDWAQKARSGDPDYRDFYFFFPDRRQPDAYDKTLREIFPEEHRGCFTYDAGLKHWVWTTFHSYQWDLNYAHPAVFRQMLEEMLFLSNLGVEVLRMDAVAFIWKRLGTACENLPEAHTILRAFNALVRLAAPAMIFKSEAIVHPRDVVSYFGEGDWAGRECEISYNPLLMVGLWEALATRHTHLLAYSIEQRQAIPANCAWVNYVRSHDDIGWGFADEDAAALHIDPFWHRQFLNRFYTGREAGSFAAGHPFQFNPLNQDMRISGTTASLAGLEKALMAASPEAIEWSLRRILLIYGIVISMGGIPLIYLGDELGQLNDYTYAAHPERHDDSRWMHRPRMDWGKAGERHLGGTLEQRLFDGLRRLIDLRRSHPVFAIHAQTRVLPSGSPHLLALARSIDGQMLTILGNFSPDSQPLPGPVARPGGKVKRLYGLEEAGALHLAPYELRLLLS